MLLFISLFFRNSEEAFGISLTLHQGRRRIVLGEFMNRADEELLKIGEVARLMGVRAQIIRNYEKQGLLKPERADRRPDTAFTGLMRWRSFGSPSVRT